jgi:Ca2+/Na+ antiporter
MGPVDWTALIASGVLLMIFAITGRRITRLEGILFLLAYGAYIAYLIGR